VGRLTKNPVFYPEGRKGDAHCTFTLAVNRVIPDENGPTADYIQCVLWGPLATTFVEDREMGDEVMVFGAIRTSILPLGNGKSEFRWELRVEEVEHGRKSLKNLAGRPTETKATVAVSRLTKEFSGDAE
jgi:single-strand DNA-binding protein